MGAIGLMPSDAPRVEPTDPDDDHVIAAALDGTAHLVASGDKRDLLPLGSFEGIPIVTAREAVEWLEARGSLTLEPLIGEDAAEAHKRGRAPKLQQHMEHISVLPRPRQPAVSDVIEAMLAQQGH